MSEKVLGTPELSRETGINCNRLRKILEGVCDAEIYELVKIAIVLDCELKIELVPNLQEGTE